jgi:hypothetical protein
MYPRPTTSLVRAVLGSDGPPAPLEPDAVTGFDGRAELVFPPLPVHAAEKTAMTKKTTTIDRRERGDDTGTSR